MDRQKHIPPTIAVAEAKQQMRIASERIDYLAPIKRHPLESAGAAFFAGLLSNRLGKSRLPPGLLSVAFQLLKRF